MQSITNTSSNFHNQVIVGSKRPSLSNSSEIVNEENEQLLKESKKIRTLPQTMQQLFDENQRLREELAQMKIDRTPFFDPNQDDLLDLIPQLKDLPNRSKKIIVLVPAADGTTKQFNLTELALQKASLVYQRLFTDNEQSIQWKETKAHGSPTFEWIDDNFGQPHYFHPQAGAQAVLSVRFLNGEIPKEKHRPIAQLLAQKNNDSDLILEDLLRISHRYEMPNLQAECKQFLLECIKNDPQVLSDYFSFILDLPSNFKLFPVWLKGFKAHLAQSPLEMIEFFSRLIDQDYSSRTQEHRWEIQKIFIQCLYEMLTKELLKKCALPELESLCRGILKVCPGLGFSLKKLQQLENVMPLSLSLDYKAVSAIGAYVRIRCWKDLEQVDSMLNKLVEDREYIELALTAQGSIFLHSKNYDDALAKCQQALQINPYCWPALRVRGFIFEQQELVDLALQDYSQILKENPFESNTLYNRGVIYLKQKKFELALKDANMALAVDPIDDDALELKASIYFYQNKWDKALIAINQALDQGFDVYRLGLRGKVYLQKGQLRQAEQDFRDLLRSYPNDQGLLKLLAQCNPHNKVE